MAGNGAAAGSARPKQQKEVAMRKLVVTEFVSLDGVVEAPEKWHASYIEEELLEAVGKRYFASDALLLGRETYHSFVGSWPSKTADDFAFADHMNAGMRKYVVSSTLDGVGKVGQRHAHQGGCRGRGLQAEAGSG
jgi:dihydrofolate reductase